MLTLSEKERLINELINEDINSTISDYLSTVKEIEAISSTTRTQRVNP